MGVATAVVDLDGVVWLAGEPLEGAGKAVALLRDAGLGVLFATNNSSPSIGDLVNRLARAEIEADPTEVVTSAQAAAAAATVGSSALVIGEAGLVEAAEARGLVEAELPDSVIVGWLRSFDFETIARSASAVRGGARLIATNDDPTHPTPNGLLPGTGALVAAISTAAEQAPLIAGKPGEQMVALVRERSPQVAVVIGDRPSTDGAFARRLGAPFGLVLSQATPRGTHGSDLAGASLLEVVERFLDIAER
jgi:HAD superfamily hydrolase (TIGR01450 family)